MALRRFPFLLSVILIAVLIFPALASWAADQPSPSEAWKMNIRQAQMLCKQYKFAEAAEWADRALRIAKSFGPLDERLPSTYYFLGGIYRDWGHCAEARVNTAHAVAAWKKIPDPVPQYVFNALVGMVNILCECDDFPSAEKFFNAHKPELQRTQSGTLGEAKVLAIEAAISREHKRYAGAEALLRKALMLLEQTSGIPQIEIAELQSSLAMVIDRQRRFGESLDFSQRAIAFFEETGARDPTLIVTLNNAACTLANMGRNEESQRMFERALAKSTEVFGEDNRTTAHIMLSYARILRENKQSPAADAMQQKGLQAYRRTLLHDHGIVDVEELQAAKK